MLGRLLLIVCAAFLLHGEACAQGVVRLWPGKAPGTETWSLDESVVETANGRRIYNVKDPTLTVYLPDRRIANGTAVIVAPGGGLRALSEDDRLVQWLNRRGFAVFVLKYRLLQQPVPAESTKDIRFPPPAFGPGAQAEMEIRHANANPSPNDARLSAVLDMAINDMQQALILVRRNAAQWGVDPHKVGVMGFSAGGGVGIGAALAAPGQAYPDFLITVYGPSLMDVNVPQHAAPLFIVVNENHYNVTNGLLALFSKWKEAGRPAELHVYDVINGAVGMSLHHQPVDSWLDRVVDWLSVRGFAPASNRQWTTQR